MEEAQSQFQHPRDDPFFSNLKSKFQLTWMGVHWWDSGWPFILCHSDTWSSFQAFIRQVLTLVFRAGFQLERSLVSTLNIVLAFAYMLVILYVFSIKWVSYLYFCICVLCICILGGGVIVPTEAAARQLKVGALQGLHLLHCHSALQTSHFCFTSALQMHTLHFCTPHIFDNFLHGQNFWSKIVLKLYTIGALPGHHIVQFELLSFACLQTVLPMIFVNYSCQHCWLGKLCSANNICLLLIGARWMLTSIHPGI